MPRIIEGYFSVVQVTTPTMVTIKNFQAFGMQGIALSHSAKLAIAHLAKKGGLENKLME